MQIIEKIQLRDRTVREFLDTWAAGPSSKVTVSEIVPFSWTALRLMPYHDAIVYVNEKAWLRNLADAYDVDFSNLRVSFNWIDELELQACRIHTPGKIPHSQSIDIRDCSIGDSASFADRISMAMSDVWVVNTPLSQQDVETIVLGYDERLKDIDRTTPGLSGKLFYYKNNNFVISFTQYGRIEVKKLLPGGGIYEAFVCGTLFEMQAIIIDNGWETVFA